MSRTVRALGAAAVAWLLPLASGVYAFLSGPGTDRSGAPDNDPYRAAAFLVMLSPVFIALLTAYFAAVTLLLARVHRVSACSLLAVAATVGLVLGLAFARQGLAVGGRPDALISFFLFGFGAFVCLGLGSLFWLWRAGRSAA